MAVGWAVTLLMVQWSALPVIMDTLYRVLDQLRVIVAIGQHLFHNVLKFHPVHHSVPHHPLPLYSI